MANLGDISKINLPNGNVVSIKDATAQTNIAFVANQGRKNVLKFDSVGGGVYSGITYTVNKDGTVSAKGTANATSYLYLMINDSAVDAKEYTNGQFILSGCPSGGGSNTYSLYAAKGSYAKFDYGDGVTLTPTSETQVFVVLRVEKNQTVDIVFKPMIRLVGTDSTFEPYSMSNAVITPELIELVDSGAKNKLNLTATSSGNFTVNSDKSITVNGSFSQAAEYTLASLTGTVKGVLSGCTNGSNSTYRMWIQYKINNGSVQRIDLLDGSVELDLSNVTWSAVQIRVESGQTLNNVKFYPMICSKAAWDVSQKFVPYSMSNAGLTKLTPTVKDSGNAFTVGTDYTLCDACTLTVPIPDRGIKAAHILAGLTFNSTAPRGIIISLSNDVSDFNTSSKLLAKVESSDFIRLTAECFYYNYGGSNVNIYVWAKSSTSGLNRVVSSMQLLN